MKDLSTIKGFIFDFDGVLVSLHSRWGKILIEGFKETTGSILEPTELLEILPKLINTTSFNGFINIKLYDIKITYKIGRSLNLSRRKTINFILNCGKVKKSQREVRYIENNGATEILNLLKEKNKKIGVVTSAKKSDYLLAIELLPMLSLVDSAITADDVDKLKPNPEGLLKIMSNLDLVNEECVYIGDFPTDMKAGQSANIKYNIGMLGELGKTMESSLKETGADFIINDLTDLIQMLD